MKTISEQLDEIDSQYPNIFKMPEHVRVEYNRLSVKLISDVWSNRLNHHGSIHSHLMAGEKDGM